jgi:hypothetical protein
VKTNKRTSVKFDFKEKGKKPIETKGILLFSITGDDFNVDRIVQLMVEQGLTELD